RPRPPRVVGGRAPAAAPSVRSGGPDAPPRACPRGAPRPDRPPVAGARPESLGLKQPTTPRRTTAPPHGYRAAAPSPPARHGAARSSAARSAPENARFGREMGLLVDAHLPGSDSGGVAARRPVQPRAHALQRVAVQPVVLPGRGLGVERLRLLPLSERLVHQ